MKQEWCGKWCGNLKAQLPHSFGRFDFPQNFHTRKLGEITVFYAVCLIWEKLLQTSQIKIDVSHVNAGFYLRFPNTLLNCLNKLLIKNVEQHVSSEKTFVS